MFYLIELSTGWCGEDSEVIIETERKYSDVEEFAWELAVDNGEMFDHEEDIEDDIDSEYCATVTRLYLTREEIIDEYGDVIEEF